MTTGIRLIGAAALGILMAGSALADERPARKAADVEPRRSCAREGAGFMSVPGSETCFRISGRVRSDYVASTSGGRADSVTGSRSSGRVQLDARIQTPAGPLRAVIRYDSRSIKN